jgi:pimeloyl-ACP methyl ester carboxylesterase
MKLKTEILGIPVDGSHVAATLIAPDTSGPRSPAVLFVHGWGGSQAQYVTRARQVAALGYVCMTLDLRGHAGTAELFESVTREENLRDTLAAYDVLAARAEVDAARVALCGYSYGGYLGAILSSLRQVRALSLLAPALYPDAGWRVPKRKLHLDADFAAYRRRTLRAIDNRALRACAQFGGDVLVVEPEKDEIIPHAVVANYLAAFANAHSLVYRVIEGADHSLSEKRWDEWFTALLVAWLQPQPAAARR